MSNIVMISVDRLRELLATEYELELLESGGVDNWDHYSDSLNPDDGGYSYNEYNEYLETLSAKDLEKIA